MKSLLTTVFRKVGLGFGAGALLALSSCTLEQKPSPALGATGTDIINHPERHLGERVAIHGIVNDAFSRGSFTVGPDGLLNTDLRVLARGSAQSIPRLHKGDRVQVAGVVRLFTKRDFLTGYSTGFYGEGNGFFGYGPAFPTEAGFYGLGAPGFYPDYYTVWEQRPIIIADRVVRQ